MPSRLPSSTTGVAMPSTGSLARTATPRSARLRRQVVLPGIGLWAVVAGGASGRGTVSDARRSAVFARVGAPSDQRGPVFAEPLAASPVTVPSQLSSGTSGVGGGSGGTAAQPASAVSARGQGKRMVRWYLVAPRPFHDP